MGRYNNGQAHQVVFGTDDSVTFTITAAYYVFGKINAIRVQDIINDKWFSASVANGVITWDYVPMVPPGTANLYIGFNVVNQGNQAGNITMTLTVGGTVVKTVTVNAAVGANVGLEWTGNMPSSNVSVTCACTP